MHGPHLFSPSTGSFYPEGFAGEIPADAVTVSAEDHAALLDAQAEGKAIEVRKGRAVAVERRPDLAELEQANRRRRDLLLRQSDWTQLPDVSLAPAKLKAWRAYRQALRDFPLKRPIEADDWPAAPDAGGDS